MLNVLLDTAGYTFMEERRQSRQKRQSSNNNRNNISNEKIKVEMVSYFQ